MSKKSLLFGLLLSICFGLILRIPLKPLFSQVNEEYHLFLSLGIKTVLLHIILFVIARQFKLFSYAGFSQPFRKNYWMLGIPLLFPGAWAYENFAINCSFLSTTLAIMPILIQGINEEVVFRGIIQGYLVKQADRPRYHLIFLYTNLLFAVGHIINLSLHHPISVINQVIYSFMIGMLFSAIQLHVNNVWLLGIVHGLVNFLYRGCGKIQVLEEETSLPGFWDYITQALGFLVLFSPALIIYWLIMKFKKPPQPDSK